MSKSGWENKFKKNAPKQTKKEEDASNSTFSNELLQSVTNSKQNQTSARESPVRYEVGDQTSIDQLSQYPITHQNEEQTLSDHDEIGQLRHSSKKEATEQVSTKRFALDSSTLALTTKDRGTMKPTASDLFAIRNAILEMGAIDKFAHKKGLNLKNSSCQKRPGALGKIGKGFRDGQPSTARTSAIVSGPKGLRGKRQNTSKTGFKIQMTEPIVSTNTTASGSNTKKKRISKISTIPKPFYKDPILDKPAKRPGPFRPFNRKPKAQAQSPTAPRAEAQNDIKKKPITSFREPSTKKQESPSANDKLALISTGDMKPLNEGVCTPKLITTKQIEIGSTDNKNYSPAKVNEVQDTSANAIGENITDLVEPFSVEPSAMEKEHETDNTMKSFSTETEPSLTKHNVIQKPTSVSEDMSRSDATSQTFTESRGLAKPISTEQELLSKTSTAKSDVLIQNIDSSTVPLALPESGILEPRDTRHNSFPLTSSESSRMKTLNKEPHLVEPTVMKKVSNKSLIMKPKTLELISPAENIKPVHTVSNDYEQCHIAEQQCIPEENNNQPINQASKDISEKIPSIEPSTHESVSTENDSIKTFSIDPSSLESRVPDNGSFKLSNITENGSDQQPTGLGTRRQCITGVENMRLPSNEDSNLTVNAEPNTSKFLNTKPDVIKQFPTELQTKRQPTESDNANPTSTPFNEAEISTREQNRLSASDNNSIKPEFHEESNALELVAHKPKVSDQHFPEPNSPFEMPFPQPLTTNDGSTEPCSIDQVRTEHDSTVQEYNSKPNTIEQVVSKQSVVDRTISEHGSFAVPIKTEQFTINESETKPGTSEQIPTKENSMKREFQLEPKPTPGAKSIHQKYQEHVEMEPFKKPLSRKESARNSSALYYVPTQSDSIKTFTTDQGVLESVPTEMDFMKPFSVPSSVAQVAARPATTSQNYSELETLTPLRNEAMAIEPIGQKIDYKKSFIKDSDVKGEIVPWLSNTGHNITEPRSSIKPYHHTEADPLSVDSRVMVTTVGQNAGKAFVSKRDTRDKSSSKIQCGPAESTTGFSQRIVVPNANIPSPVRPTVNQEPFRQSFTKQLSSESDTEEKVKQPRATKFIETSTSISRDPEPIRLTFSKKTYLPDWIDLDRRPLPRWYDEAKIGIIIHWGVYSVPSYKSEWFWYLWKKGNKEIQEFMSKKYPAGFSYQEFAPLFKAQYFDPIEWASLFAKSGAKYVILTAKHHDGFRLFPSKTAFNWNSFDVGPKRDIVKDLSEAVTGKGLKFGIYYSLYEWFNPVYEEDKKTFFKTRDYVNLNVWPDLKKLVKSYKPSIIWADGDWEANEHYWKAQEFISWVYNDSPIREDVVVNNRWGCKQTIHGDFYNRDERHNQPINDSIFTKFHKWERSLTMDKQQCWCHRRDIKFDDIMCIEEIIYEIMATVSCGGNILINVGPTEEGLITPLYEERLLQLGEWLKINGEAVYGSSPWIYPVDDINNTVFYTCIKDHYDPYKTAAPPLNPGTVIAVYAVFLIWPGDGIVKIRNVMAFMKETPYIVTLLGENMYLTANVIQDDVFVLLPDKSKIKSKYAWTLKFISKDSLKESLGSIVTPVKDTALKLSKSSCKLGIRPDIKSSSKVVSRMVSNATRPSSKTGKPH